MSESDEIEYGDIVECIGNPSLDSRRVIGVGCDWVILDFQAGVSGATLTPLPKANYRVRRKAVE